MRRLLVPVLGDFGRHNEVVFKKVLLSLITFLCSFLAINFGIQSLSLFLQTFGPESLPIMMIITSVLSVSISFLDAALSRKISSRKIYLGMFLGLLVIFFALWVLPFDRGIRVFLLYISANLLFFALDIGNISFLNSFFTPFQAKVELPAINSFFSVGSLVGALTVTMFSFWHEQLGLGSLPFFLALFICFLIFASSRFFPEHLRKTPHDRHFWSGIKRSYRYVFFESKLFRALVFFTFFTVCIHYFIEFKYRTVLAGSLSANDLTQFLGYVSFLKSILSIFMEMFLVKRMLLRFGVMRMLLSYPIGLLIALILVVIFQFHYLAVALLYLVFLLLFYGYVLLTLTQVYSILPAKNEHEIYFFVRGILGGLFLFLVSCILLLFSWNIHLEASVNTLMIFICLIGAIFFLLRLQKLYQLALVQNLFGMDRELQLKSIDLLAEKIQKNGGENDLRRLLANASLDIEVQKRLIHSMAVIGNTESVVDLLDVFKRGKPKTMFATIQAINQMSRANKKLQANPLAKRLLVEAYERAFIQNTPPEIKLEILSSLRNFELDEVIVFLEKALASKDVDMKVNAIETIGSFRERAVISYLKPFLDSSELFVRCAAIVGLWQFEDQRVSLIPLVAEVLNQDDLEGKEASLFVIFNIRATWEDRYVMDLLDEDISHKKTHQSWHHLKIYGLLTLIQLGKREFIPILVQKCLVSLRGGKTDELKFILKVYRKLDFDSKHAILDEIKKLGNQEVEMFAELFRDSDYSFVEEMRELGE